MNGNQFDIVAYALLLGALALVPLFFVITTSYLKVSLVLMVTRNALGVQQVPPSMAIYGMALAITLFIMAPTGQEIGRRGLAVEAAVKTEPASNMLEQAPYVFAPLREFMLRFSRPEQRDIFMATAKKTWPKEYAAKATPSDTLILVPAFVVSELQTGFEIGFLIYVPFVVVDLLVANLLMALGMQQVSPNTITVPLKLLLFVMVDGWGKLLNALAMSYT